jgi:hypothetical protein
MRLAWKPAANEPVLGPLAFDCCDLRTPPAGACRLLWSVLLAAAAGVCLRVCFPRPILAGVGVPQAGVRRCVQLDNGHTHQVQRNIASTS